MIVQIIKVYWIDQKNNDLFDCYICANNILFHNIINIMNHSLYETIIILYTNLFSTYIGAYNYFFFQYRFICSSYLCVTNLFAMLNYLFIL